MALLCFGTWCTCAVKAYGIGSQNDIKEFLSYSYLEGSITTVKDCTDFKGSDVMSRQELYMLQKVML